MEEKDVSKADQLKDCQGKEEPGSTKVTREEVASKMGRNQEPGQSWYGVKKGFQEGQKRIIYV